MFPFSTTRTFTLGTIERDIGQLATLNVAVKPWRGWLDVGVPHSKVFNVPMEFCLELVPVIRPDHLRSATPPLQAVEQWRVEVNEYRPHGALEQKTPAAFVNKPDAPGFSHVRKSPDRMALLLNL